MTASLWRYCVALPREENSAVGLEQLCFISSVYKHLLYTLLLLCLYSLRLEGDSEHCYTHPH